MTRLVPQALIRSGLASDLLAAVVVLLGGAIFNGPAGLGFTGAAPPRGGPPPVPLGMSIGALVLVLVPAAAMFVRRQLPVPVFVATLICTAAAVLSDIPSTAAGIGLVIAAHGCAYRASRRLALLAILTATALLPALGALVSNGAVFEPRNLQIVAAMLIAAALGDGARARSELLAAVTERAERAERTREAEASRRVSEERLRIARDLHDTVAHQISVISLNAGAASRAVHQHPDRAEAALVSIREASREVLSEIGDLLRYLRADDDDLDGGPTPGPQPGIARIADLVAGMRAAGLAVQLDLPEPEPRIPESIGVAVYRVVQEGLTNAQKHGIGGTTAVRVRVDGDELSIRIENPIAVESLDSLEATNGFGLVGIGERIAALGGTYSAGASDDRFVLEVRLPVAKEAGR